MAYKMKGFPMVEGTKKHTSALKDTGEQRGDFTKHVSNDPHKHQPTIKSTKLANKAIKERIKKDIEKAKEEIQKTKESVKTTKDTITQTKENIIDKAENVKKEDSPIKKGKVGEWWSGLEGKEKAMLIGGGAIGAGLLLNRKRNKNQQEEIDMMRPQSGLAKKSPTKVHKSGHKSKEQKARDKYYKKGEKIEAQLKSAKKPGKTTTLRKVKYNSLVNRLEKMYKGMYPGEPVNLGFGTWKPYNKK